MQPLLRQNYFITWGKQGNRYAMALNKTSMFFGHNHEKEKIIAFWK
jgi:hypothetical protein